MRSNGQVHHDGTRAMDSWPNYAMKHIIQRSKMFAPKTVSDKAIDISRPNQSGINRVLT
jgi:hypothetical protein